jgi:glycosyltransferase involved in cell wall biosynthesis
MILDKLPPMSVGGAEIQAVRLGKELQLNGLPVSFAIPGRDDIKGKSTLDGMTVYFLHSLLNYPWDFLSSRRKKNNSNVDVRIEYDDSKEITNEVMERASLAVRLRYQIFLVNSFFFMLRHRRNFDIIHVHSMGWPSFIAARLGKWFKKKVVVKDATMNGIRWLQRYPSGERKLRLVKRQCHFVAMTRVIEENLLLAGVEQHSISRIPNGIEIEGHPYKSEYGGEIKKVIFVGNLTQQPAKGIDLLLKAWKSIQKKFKDVQLQIVGDGPVTTYEKYAQELGINNSVSFLGKRTDVKQLLVDADLFVLPSRREGMPNALMEAMLSGLPSVATNISGCQDLIEHMNSGFLINPASVSELESGIEFFLKNPLLTKTMGERARLTIQENFNIQNVASKYISLYYQLADRTE